MLMRLSMGVRRMGVGRLGWSVLCVIGWRCLSEFFDVIDAFGVYTDMLL
jgi:hypothetical protein